MRESNEESLPLNPKRAPPASVREIRSEQLLEGAREIIIVHGDSRYRLQVTKAGKLILIK